MSIPLFFLFILLPCASLQKNPCLRSLTLNITDGKVIGQEKILKDGVIFTKDNYFYENGTILGCICNIKKCVRKCCEPDKVISEKTCVKENYPLNVSFHEGTENVTLKSNQHYIHGMLRCEFGITPLLPHMYDDNKFYLQTNGSLLIPDYEGTKFRHIHEYCIEVISNEMMGLNYSTTALICNHKEEIVEEDEVGDLHKLGMIISMPFLLATFLVYALLPDRNLHMKALMSYVINLMLSYLLLVIIQLSKTRFPDTQCQLIGYFCLFFFIVSFFWMNVICIDIWFTFSGLRGFSGSRGAERKRFLLYCAYAWGMSILHILVVFTVDRLSRTGLFYKPDIGSGQCFLKRGYPELLYFYGPMAVLISINITLFAITAIKIRAIKKDTSMLKKEDSKRHSYENDKQTFNLYLKLLFAMGVNWSMEIISWAVNWSLGEGNAPPAIWYLTDFCNAIYGVFIFFIFVFKRSIWKLLKKRYYSFIGKPHLAHSMTQNPTRVTSYSTTQTSVSDHHGGVNDNTVLTSEA